MVKHSECFYFCFIGLWAYIRVSERGWGSHISWFVNQYFFFISLLPVMNVGLCVCVLLAALSSSSLSLPSHVTVRNVKSENKKCKLHHLHALITLLQPIETGCFCPRSHRTLRVRLSCQTTCPLTTHARLAPLQRPLQDSSPTTTNPRIALMPGTAWTSFWPDCSLGKVSRTS